MYGEDLAARTIVEMVTLNPAKAFRMQKEIGSVAEGKLADLLVIARSRGDPCESLLAARAEDIELLVMEGTPIFGAAAHEELFASRGAQHEGAACAGARCS